MSPSIAPPSPEALAELVSAHAGRFPEIASVDVIGDDGEEVRLPLLIGNPTGAVKPPGDRVLPVWADLVALSMGAARPSEGIADALARDCLIYPTPAILGGWEDRWPAVLDSIGIPVARKIGMQAEQVIRAPKPAPPGTHLLGRAKLPAILTTPTRAHYVALKAAVRREGADHVALLDELLAACVRGDGVATLLIEQPGLALPLYKAVMRLAGELQNARLGEW